MDLVSKLIGSYSSIYTFIQRNDDINKKLQDMKIRRKKLKSLPRTTLEEEKEYLRKKELFETNWEILTNERKQWIKDLKTQYPVIYREFREFNDPMKATIEFGTKRDKDALLYDILISNPQDDARLERFLNLMGMTRRQLQDFILKNDIYQRAEMLESVERLNPHYIKSVEMARELVKLFPNDCNNIGYLYKVNDLEGVNSFLKETKCSKDKIHDQFTSSLAYIHDLTAYKHIVQKAKILGIEIDSAESIFDALENRNPSIPIHILESYDITNIDNRYTDIREMRSEVLQYILENNIRIDLDSLFNDKFVLTSIPSDYLQKKLKEADLSEPVKYIIV